jgi:hypothetical protein
MVSGGGHPRRGALRRRWAVRLIPTWTAGSIAAGFPGTPRQRGASGGVDGRRGPRRIDGAGNLIGRYEGTGDGPRCSSPAISTACAMAGSTMARWA